MLTKHLSISKTSNEPSFFLSLLFRSCHSNGLFNACFTGGGLMTHPTPSTDQTAVVATAAAALVEEDAAAAAAAKRVVETTTMTNSSSRRRS
jgi:hypothetical protein